MDAASESFSLWAGLGFGAKPVLQKLTLRKQLTFTADAQQSLAFEHMQTLMSLASRDGLSRVVALLSAVGGAGAQWRSGRVLDGCSGPAASWKAFQ
jgi:hypothetical protein